MSRVRASKGMAKYANMIGSQEGQRMSRVVQTVCRIGENYLVHGRSPGSTGGNLLMCDSCARSYDRDCVGQLAEDEPADDEDYVCILW